MYLHQRNNWWEFNFNKEAVMNRLGSARAKQGIMLGRMQSLGFDFQDEAMLTTMSLELVRSCEIEGEVLSLTEVRSSIARRLGIDASGLVPASRYVEGSPGPGTASPSYGYESSSPTTTPVTATINGYGYSGGSDATSSAPTLTNYQPFSVGGGKQIYFSPGNLQYQASTGIWRFAQHQWDIVGGTNSNETGTVYEGGVRSHNLTPDTYVNQVCLRSQYSGWIDLFGWGTTGINYRNFQPFSPSPTSGPLAPEEYQPWVATNNERYYGPLSGDLSGDSDWGVNMGNGYRTPTPEELEYIMDRVNTNPDNCCYMHAWFYPGSRTFKITFTAKEDPSYTEQFTVTQPSYPVFMVILFPDGISKTSLLVSAYSSHINNNQTRKELTLEQLLELQNAGCVILPATGRRSGASTLLETRYPISYWTNKAGIASNSAVVAVLGLKSTYQFNRIGGDRFYGRPVRLVKDVTP